MKKIILIQLILFTVISLQEVARADLYMQINLDPADVVFMITDPMNNTAGFDPATGQTISKENFSYGYAEQSDPQTGRVVASSQEFGGIGLSPGTYKIMTYGKKLTIYGAGIAIDWDGYPNGLQVYFSGLADTGKIDTYEFTVPPTPATTIAILRVATATNLTTDINASNKLGYLGNSEFVQELIKKVQKIEKERLNPEEKEEHELATPAQRAIKKYQKLLKEITEHYQKPEKDEFIKEEAYTVLKEDLEYIISHIQ